MDAAGKVADMPERHLELTIRVAVTRKSRERVTVAKNSQNETMSKLKLMRPLLVLLKHF
jgi:hypothetical protein